MDIKTLEDMVDRLGEILGVDSSSVFVEFEKDHDVEAEIEYIDNDCSIITIREGLSDESLKRCLAHEMVHFKQHQEGRLASGHLKMVWNDIEYTDYDYTSAPWEQEAYALEDILSKMI